jgi:general secretion pathway protein E
MAIEETHDTVNALARTSRDVSFDDREQPPTFRDSAPTDLLPKASFEMLAAGRPCLDKFSVQFLREVGMYLYEDAAGDVHAAISNHQQMALVDTVAWTLQCRVSPEFASRDDIAAALERVVHGETSRVPSNGPLAAGRFEAEEDTVESLRDLASGAPVVRAVNEIIEIALQRRATDIHLEPVREGIRVRIRVDGILMTVRTFTTELARPIVSRVKILAGLNIAERRLPQDGRTHIRVGNFDADVRIATMPTAFG